jgi:hypothetical protein
MSTERNRETALAFIETMSQGKLDESVLAPGVSWWVPGMGDFTKDEFKAIVENFGSALRGPMRMIIDGVTAENDRVAVEAHAIAELANGRSYRNTYHFLFVFENGKILRAKEYNDSKHAAETLGPLLPLR